MNNEQRLKELEKKVAELQRISHPCVHKYSGLYFNMGNAYEQCDYCGKRVRL